MTQSPNTPSPNSQPNPPVSVEYSDDEKKLLDIKKIDAWRSYQHEILNGLREADTDFINGEYLRQFNENINDSLDEYLVQQGIDSSSANYANIRKLYRESSIDNIRDDVWYASPAARGDNFSNKVSDRDRVISAVSNELGRGASDNVEMESTNERLTQLHRAKQEAFVDKLRGPAFGRKKQELEEAYKNAELAYMVALTRQNKQFLLDKRAELEAAGKAGDELESELREIAEGEASRLAKEDKNEQHRMLVEKSGLMGKFLENWGNLSGKKKVAAALGLGAVSLIAGAGMGLAAGVAGGLIGAGVASAAGGVLARGLGAARIYQLRKAELFKTPDEYDQLELSDDDKFESLHLKQRAFLERISREQLENGDKIKKRAVLWTLGTVAVGGVAGVAAHAIADSGALDHVPGGQIQHWLEGRGANHLDGGGSGGDRKVGFGDYRVEVEPGRGIPPVDEGGIAPESGVSRSEAIEQYINQHEQASVIDSGEGWYQTFQELGVAPENYHDLLQQLGPELQNITHDGMNIAYWDENAQEWYMNMTSDQKMPSEALRLIVERAQDNGYLESPLQFDIEPVLGPGGVDTEDRGLELADQAIDKGEILPMNIVDPSEGWYQTFNELREAGVVDIPPEQYDSFLRQVGPELAKLRYSDSTPVAYFDRFAYEWRMYESPDGRMSREAIRLITRYALRSNHTLAS